MDIDDKGTVYLVNEVSAKITFTSGRLAGQQFELEESLGILTVVCADIGCATLYPQASNHSLIINLLLFELV